MQGRTQGSSLRRMVDVGVITIGRNEGEHLRRCLTSVLGRGVPVVYVDSEVVPTWLDRARRELESRDDAAVVCGRRRERHPEHSVYNRLADLEWDRPPGEVQSCGGDAVVR